MIFSAGVRMAWKATPHAVVGAGHARDCALGWSIGGCVVARSGKSRIKSVSLRRSGTSRIAAHRFESQAGLSVRPSVGGCVVAACAKSKIESFRCGLRPPRPSQLLNPRAELSLHPSGAPSHFSLGGQREVTRRKATRGSRFAHCVSEVPCVARKSAAGANSAIHGLEHARLSLLTCCATRREHGTLRVDGPRKTCTHAPRPHASAKASPVSLTQQPTLLLLNTFPVIPRCSHSSSNCHQFKRLVSTTLGCGAISLIGRSISPRPLPLFVPSNGASRGSKARMFEHRDVRVRAGPRVASSAGDSARFASAARTSGGLSPGYFSLATQREVTRGARRAQRNALLFERHHLACELRCDGIAMRSHPVS